MASIYPQCAFDRSPPFARARVGALHSLRFEVLEMPSGKAQLAGKGDI
jgi:hypothetical protein